MLCAALIPLIALGFFVASLRVFLRHRSPTSPPSAIAARAFLGAVFLALLAPPLSYLGEWPRWRSPNFTAWELQQTEGLNVPFLAVLALHPVVVAAYVATLSLFYLGILFRAWVRRDRIASRGPGVRAFILLPFAGLLIMNSVWLASDVRWGFWLLIPADLAIMGSLACGGLALCWQRRGGE